MAAPRRSVRRAKKGDVTQHITHYVRAVWRRKRIVLLTVPLVAVAAAGIMLRKGILRPELEARVIFGIETATQLGVSELLSDIGDYRVELVRSRNFLTEVVRELSLQLVLPDHGRQELFDTIRVTPAAALGTYTFDVAEGHTRDDSKKAYRIRYTNRGRVYENRAVSQGTLGDGSIRLPGISVVLSGAYRRNPHDFSFRIISEEDAASKLLNRLTVQPPNRSAPDHFSVSLLGTDYQLLAKTLNVLADRYVDQNTELRRRRSSQRLAALEKQLASAREQFEESEAALRQFLSAHPSATLEERVARTVTSIAGLEADSRNVEQDLSEARRLRARLQKKDERNQPHVIRDVLVFLDSRDVPGAAGMRDELSRLLETQMRYKHDYMPNHPLIRQNTEEIQEVGERTMRVVNEYIARLRRQVASNEHQVEQLSQDLRNLPQRSLEHAELQRRHEISSDIYTSLQTSYN
ncbi:MAG: hypothetical protein GF331_18355, partial [Chitinivibrionales bacterium]|nr:hypothetical protein [Chitinivibrionales bacterium]